MGQDAEPVHVGVRSLLGDGVAHPGQESRSRVCVDVDQRGACLGQSDCDFDHRARSVPQLDVGEDRPAELRVERAHEIDPALEQQHIEVELEAEVAVRIGDATGQLQNAETVRRVQREVDTRLGQRPWSRRTSPRRLIQSAGDCWKLR